MVRFFTSIDFLASLFDEGNGRSVMKKKRKTIYQSKMSKILDFTQFSLVETTNDKIVLERVTNIAAFMLKTIEKGLNTHKLTKKYEKLAHNQSHLLYLQGFTKKHMSFSILNY